MLAPQYGQRQRQLRLRVLEALELRVKQFIRREELWPIRVPREPLLLDGFVRQALGPEAGALDVPALRSRPLLTLGWTDGSSWEAWVIVLPSKLKVYCDSSGGEHRVLASAGRNEGDESDRVFLQLLAESGGEHFGIAMEGGAPTRVRCAIEGREFLIDLFVELFEVSGSEDSVREVILERAGALPDESAGGRDFRADVAAWLDLALRSS